MPEPESGGYWSRKLEQLGVESRRLRELENVLVVLSPSTRGICTSISTTSGRVSDASRTAASPSAASPTTTIPLTPP